MKKIAAIFFLLTLPLASSRGTTRRVQDPSATPFIRVFFLS